MIMNSPAALVVGKKNIEALEAGRQLEEHCRNVDRLIAYNNRRVSHGLRPVAFPSPLVMAGMNLINRVKKIVNT